MTCKYRKPYVGPEPGEEGKLYCWNVNIPVRECTNEIEISCSSKKEDVD